MDFKFKNQLKTSLLLQLIIAFNVHAYLPDSVSPEIGPWDFSYSRCSHPATIFRGFNSEAAAQATGIEEIYPTGCSPTIVSDDPGFPSEDPTDPRVDYFNCHGIGTYPSYRLSDIPYANVKNISVDYFRLNGNNECISYTDGLVLFKDRRVTCPENYKWNNTTCIKQHEPEAIECPISPTIGNPINTATGKKFHKETIDLLIDSLPFSISYSSSTATQAQYYGLNSIIQKENTIGIGWNHIYAKEISGVFVDNGKDSIFVRKGDGKLLQFTEINGDWINSSNTPATLMKVGSEWILTNSENQIETYNYYGKLIKVSNNGNTITLDYEQGEFEYDFSAGNYKENFRLSRITTANGKYINFEYGFNLGLRVSKIINSNNQEWGIEYANYGGLSKITYPDNSNKEFHYGELNNSPYKLTGITDRNGNRFASYDYKYGEFNEWHHATDENGNDIKVDELTVSFAYVPFGTEYEDRIQTVTNSKGDVSTYTVTYNNGLWQLKDILGPGCSNCSNPNSSYEYDPNTNDLLSKTIDGKTTVYGNYDAKGQYGFKIEASGTSQERRTDYTYDPRFFKKRLTITEDSVSSNSNDKKVTTYAYDSHANITSMTISGHQVDGTVISQTTTYQYNGPLNQISQIDGPRTDVSDITTFEYYANDPIEANNRSRLKKHTNGTGIVLRNNIQYTASGKVLSEEKPNGLTTSYNYYPANNRLETLSNSDGNKTIVTRMVYLASGEIKKIIRNFGTTDVSKLTLGYDNAKRLTSVKDAKGNYVKFTLDTDGNQEFEKTYDPNGVLKKTIAQVFDEYDQLESITQSGITNHMQYGSNGNLYEQANGNNVKTEYDYDDLNRLTQITQDLNGSTTTANTITTFEYDSSDRVNKVTDANNNDTLYEYDDLGRLTKLVSPDTGTDIFTYDSANNVISKTDAKGNLTNFTYDGNNRPLTIDYEGTNLDVTFVYDQTGAGFSNGINQLTSFFDNKSSTSFSYDAFGNLIKKSQNVLNVTANNNITTDVSYQFDSANRMESITYPSGLLVNYHYNRLNQIKRVTTSIDGQNIDILKNINYLPMGPLKSMKMGNGLNFNSSYDNGYRLENYNYGNKLSGNYSYDNNHNITNLIRETANNSDAFGYDDLDRINLENKASKLYTYDNLGNRTSSQKDTSPVETYTYKANSNKLLKIGTAEPRQYDANGNTRFIPSENIKFNYNKANRLKNVKINDVKKGIYTYNGVGQRIYKKRFNSSNKPLYYIYNYNSYGQLIHESKYTKNSLKQKYSRETIWLNNKPVAQIRTTYTNGVVTATNIYYILSDHLNTPRKVTNDTGTVLWSWNSDAFGMKRPKKDVDGDGKKFEFNLMFPGQYYDAESGKHYNYFRDYEPGTGRYLESDPIGLNGGMNTFGYTLSNPINYSESLGLYAVPVWLCGTPWTAAVCVCGGAILYIWGDSGNPNNDLSLNSGGGRIIPFPGTTTRTESCKNDECEDGGNNSCLVEQRKLLGDRLALTNLFNSGLMAQNQFVGAASLFNQKVVIHNPKCPNNKVAPFTLGPRR